MAGRSTPLARAWLLALLPALGCTPSVNGNPFQPPPTGTGGTTGHPSPSGTVTVVIDTPTRDPVQPFGTGSLVAVSARVDVDPGSGTDFLDGTSVKATVTAMGSTLIVENGQLVLSAGDIYTGRVSLGDLPSGTYTLTVTAASSGGAIGKDSVDFTVDAGPVIVINSPVEGKSYKKSLTIEVVARDPAGLAAGSPTASVGSIAVPLADAGVMDTFRGTIFFDDQMPPLFGPQLLTVVATNVNGRRTEVQVIFQIDNDGPTITDTHPIPGEIVGGIVPIAATIKDPAGILDASVIVVIGDETGTPIFEFALKPTGVSTYGILFDSNQLTKCPDPPGVGPCIVYPTISFRVSDQVGNESVLGYAFTLDNVAPVADLDSADVRMFRQDGYCSRLFDPLSLNRYVGDMPNDATVVPQVFDLRARVEDGGNAPAGIKEVPIAGIDPDATSVYILDDVSMPLVVDVDGDGTCDAINPKLVPTTQPPTQNNQVLKVRLAGVPKQGAPDYRADLNPPPASICSYPPTALPPLYLCDTGQPYAAISYAHGQPAIWSVEPINAAWCMGGQFDTLGNHIDEGWACIAVQSSDRAGNTSVSPPLRVYIKYDGAGAGNPAPGSLGAPPPCTGSYDKASDTVSNQGCTSRRFDQIDYIYDGID